jgi:hypothetical protein
MGCRARRCDRRVAIAGVDASRLLRFSNLDERIETENQAVLALARKRQLVS